RVSVVISLRAGIVSDGQTEHRRATGGNPLILFWFVSMVSRFRRVSLRAGIVSDGQTEHRRAAFPSCFFTSRKRQ
ncbi:MAG: hypothetical protein NT142_12840, partial [Planctomycetota bacterium]|nr:hypothetical protein [Planctomycetota bacterium]